MNADDVVGGAALHDCMSLDCQRWLYQAAFQLVRSPSKSRCGKHIVLSFCKTQTTGYASIFTLIIAVALMVLHQAIRLEAEVQNTLVGRRTLA